MLQQLRRLWTGVFDSRAHRAEIRQAYALLVQAARQPDLYSMGHVIDDYDGRFESLALHVAMVINRLRDDGAEGAAFAQDLFDCFFADIDNSLRERGVSDMRFAKVMKKAAEHFHGRMQSYAKHEEMSAALRRNLYRGAAVDEQAFALMLRYIEKNIAQLASQPRVELLAGHVRLVPFLAITNAP